MNKIAIVTDSDSGLNLQTAKELDVTLLCKPLNCETKEIIDTVTLTYDEFLKEMKDGAHYKTSQMPLIVVEETFEELLKTHDYVLYFPISSKLSTAYENGVNIANQFGGRVHVLDHKTVAYFQLYEILVAKKLIADGLDFKEICDRLDARGGKAFAYVIPESLVYLKRGGRVSPAVAALGGLIGLTPLLMLKDGGIDKHSVCRTYKAAIRKAIDEMATYGYTPETHKLFILHTKEEEKANEIVKLIKAKEELKGFEPVVSLIPGVILVHAGPGTIAFGFSPIEK